MDIRHIFSVDDGMRMDEHLLGFDIKLIECLYWYWSIMAYCGRVSWCVGFVWVVLKIFGGKCHGINGGSLFFG